MKHYLLQSTIIQFYNFVPSIIFNYTLIISITVPLIDNTFHLQLYQSTVSSGNTKLHEILITHLMITYLTITNDEQYYTCPVDMDIMRHLVPKWHYRSQSGGLYPVQGSNVCSISLPFQQ